MKVSNDLDLSLTLTFTSKHNHAQCTFKIYDNVCISYNEINEGLTHIQGRILAFHDKDLILQKDNNYLEEIYYTDILDIIKL